MPNRTVILGLDGVDFNILSHFSGKQIPNIKRVLEKGCSGDLISTLPPVTVPAWPSFSTGCRPDKLGIYSFMKFSNEFKNIEIRDSRDLEKKTFYEILNERGFKSILIGLPLSFPLKTRDITIPSYVTKTDANLLPNEAKKRIKSKIGKEALDFKTRLNIYRRRAVKVINNCLDFMDERKKVIDYLKSNEGWDVFFRLFSVTDWINHYSLNKFDNPKFRENVVEVYKRIDEEVADFLSLEDTNIILMSDHGFKVYKKIFYINKWLENKGLLERGEGQNRYWPDVPTPIKLLREIVGLPFLRNLSYFILDNLWEFLNIHNDIKLRLEAYLTPKPDFENSKAFYPHNSTRGIFLNNEGNIKNSEEFKRNLCRKLENLGFVDRAVINRTPQRKNLEAPDILLEFGGYMVVSNLSNRVKRNSIKNEHKREGFFAALGPDFKKGVRKEASILDITPTLLELFGIGAPDYMDGKVLADILKN